MTPIRLLLSVAALALLTVASGAQAPSEKWDITTPTGPTSTVSFDTTEGTWMNVDVSPDGRRVVFDLLGDLYTMPIDGSSAAPATRITTGVAFDMQPRYQPGRGRRWSFISDRGGLFNVWVADADGDTRAAGVSQEQQLVDQQPDLVAGWSVTFTRAVTSSANARSAPAKMWMFHVSGSEGVAGHRTRRASRRMLASRPSLLMAGPSTTAGTCLPGPNFDYNRDPVRGHLRDLRARPDHRP